MTKRTVKPEAPEPNDAEKAALGEPVQAPQPTPDFVAEPTTGPGNPASPGFVDLSPRTCYERAAMALLFAEVHAGEDPNEHRENAKAWSSLGNNMIAVGPHNIGV